MTTMANAAGGTCRVRNRKGAVRSCVWVPGKRGGPNTCGRVEDALSAPGAARARRARG